MKTKQARRSSSASSSCDRGREGGREREREREKALARERESEREGGRGRERVLGGLARVLTSVNARARTDCRWKRDSMRRTSMRAFKKMS